MIQSESQGGLQEDLIQSAEILEASYRHLLVQVGVRLQNAGRAQIRVELPEYVGASDSVLRRDIECPDPPCHELMRFNFSIEPGSYAAPVYSFPVHIVVQATNGARQERTLGAELR